MSISPRWRSVPAGAAVEFVELLEAAVVQDALQRSVKVVADAAVVVEDEARAVLGRVGLPGRQALDIGIPGRGEVRPAAAHIPGQLPVGLGRLGKDAAVEIGRVETEVQFVAVHRPLVRGGFPGKHIQVGGRYARRGDGIDGNQGLGAEHHVNGQEVLRGVVRPRLGEGRDVFFHPVAEGGNQLLLGFFQRHLRTVGPALELIEGRADHQRDIGGNVRETGLERLLKQHFAVGRGAEAPHHRRTRRPGADAGGHGPLARRHQLAVRHVGQLVQLVRADPQLIHDRAAELLGHRFGIDIEDGAAHNDGLVEQAPGGRHAHQGADLAASARLAEDGDVVRVAAESLDIVPDPFQRLHDVQHPHHPGVLVLFAEGGQVQETEDVQPMVEAHDHHILLGQAHPGIPGGRTRIESAAMDPQHHGLGRLSVRGPDVQHAGVLFRHHAFRHFAPAASLHHLRSEMVADHHGVPFGDGLRWHEPLYRGIGNPFEGQRAFLFDAFDQSGLRPDNQRIRRRTGAAGSHRGYNADN